MGFEYPQPYIRFHWPDIHIQVHEQPEQGKPDVVLVLPPGVVVVVLVGGAVVVVLVGGAVVVVVVGGAVVVVLVGGAVVVVLVGGAVVVVVALMHAAGTGALSQGLHGAPTRSDQQMQSWPSQPVAGA